MGDANFRWAATERLPTLVELLDEARPGHQAWIVDHVRRPPAHHPRRPQASGARAARRHRRLHLEAAAPRPAPEPHRDREDHGRPRRRRPGGNHTDDRSLHHPRTYLFALVDGGGTVPPELGTVRRLVERGHRVTVLAEDSMRDDVDRQRRHLPPVDRGAQPARPPPRARPLPRLGVQDPVPAVQARCSTSSSSAPLPPTPPTRSPPIADERPDLVVCSFLAIGAMVGAEAAGLPFDVLFPNPYMLPAPGMPPFGLGSPAGQGALGRLRDRAVEPPDGPAVGQGPARPQRAAGGARPRAGGALLRPDPSGPPRPRAHLGRLRLPRRAARQRPLRRPGARRPRLGGGHALDRAGRRRSARAGGAVVHVPGPRRLPPAHRRRPRHAAGARASSPPVPPSTPASSARPPTWRS